MNPLTDFLKIFFGELGRTTKMFFEWFNNKIEVKSKRKFIFPVKLDSQANN